MINKFLIGTFFLTVVCAASIIFAFPQGFFSRPKTGPQLSTNQINQAIQGAGGQAVLAKEVTDAVLQFGSNDLVAAEQLTNCPATVKFASLVGGEFLGLWPSNPGVPAHVQIRRGGHFDCQFIYIFPPKSLPTMGANGLIPVGGPAYLRNTKPNKLRGASMIN